MKFNQAPVFQLAKKTVQSVTKYFAKSKKLSQKWTRQENFGIWFHVSFDRYCQKLIFGGETTQF